MMESDSIHDLKIETDYKQYIFHELKDRNGQTWLMETDGVGIDLDRRFFNVSSFRYRRTDSGERVCRLIVDSANCVLTKYTLGHITPSAKLRHKKRQFN